MISKRDLYVKMGWLMSDDQFEKVIEEAIIKEAQEGKRVLNYTFPDKVDKHMIDMLYQELDSKGFETQRDYNSKTAPYERITIRW